MKRILFWYFFAISASGSISFSPVFRQEHECAYNAQATQLLLAGRLQEPAAKVSPCMTSSTPEQ